MRRRTIAQRLAERIVRELPAHGHAVPETLRVVRLHPSRADRNLGAWSWTTVNSAEPSQDVPIGSQWRMSTVLRAPVWVVTRDGYGDISIDPPPDGLITWSTGNFDPDDRP